MSESTDSTRTIASVAAVLGIVALVFVFVESSRTGLVAQVAGTANAVAQQNDVNLLRMIEAQDARIKDLEAKVNALESAGGAAAAAEAPAPAAPE